MEYHQGCIGVHLGQAAAAAVAVWLPVSPSLGVTVTEVFERCQKWQSLFDGVGETLVRPYADILQSCWAQVAKAKRKRMEKKEERQTYAS